MRKINIGGQEYVLRMDLYTVELLEEEFGSLKAALSEFFEGKKKIAVTRKLFAALANSGRSWEGKTEDVTGDALKHCSMMDMMQITEAIKQTVNDGMHAETLGGEADDQVRDVYLAEIEAEENKKKEE